MKYPKTKKNQKIQLFKTENLDEFSHVKETERDFRIRLQHIAREKHDQQADNLREKYAKKLDKLDEKLRRAQIKLEESKAQARVQKYQTAVSFGSVLLGGFVGRKSVGSVTNTTREVSRTMKKAREREYAKENLSSLQQEKKDLKTQFESDVEKLETAFDPTNEHRHSDEAHVQQQHQHGYTARDFHVQRRNRVHDGVLAEASQAHDEADDQRDGIGDESDREREDDPRHHAATDPKSIARQES